MTFVTALVEGLEGVAAELRAEGSQLVHAVEEKLGELRPLLAGDTRQAELAAVQAVKELAGDTAAVAAAPVPTPEPAPAAGTAEASPTAASAPAADGPSVTSNPAGATASGTPWP